MASSFTPQRYLTTQQAYGRVAIATGPDWNLMVWNGTDDAHSLNIAVAAGGSFTFPSASMDQAGSPETNLCGPAFALLPNGAMGYAAWVNADNKIAIGLARATASADPGGAPTWSLSASDIWVITASQPASPPAVAIDASGSSVLLTVIWQDSASGSLAQAQVEFGNESQTLAFQPVSWACCAAGAPTLVRAGGRIFAGWTADVADNGYGSFTLYAGPSGGPGCIIPFEKPPASNLITTRNLSVGANGLGCVPADRTYGFIVSGGPKLVGWSGIGANARNQWQLNNAVDSYGQVSTTVTPLATVFAKGLHVIGTGSQAASCVLAAWPEATAPDMPNEVVVTLFVPVLVPIAVS